MAAVNRIVSEATMDIGMSLFLVNALMAALVYIVVEIIWQD
ncbi:MAG: hypothetical protein NTNFB02_33090 [Nitrospira sp.]